MKRSIIAEYCLEMALDHPLLIFQNPRPPDPLHVDSELCSTSFELTPPYLFLPMFER